jgi:YggT family protein
LNLLIYSLIQAMIVLIFARIVASFFVRDWAAGLPRIIWDLTEPILAPLRRVVPRMGMFDFTPTVALLLLYFLSGVFRGR